MNYQLRNATPDDYFDTEVLTREAFWDLFRPGCDEHLMVHQMRQSEDYVPALDYVALSEGRIVGHILYSKARLVSDTAEHTLLAFGPLSVLPACQRKGIGGALILRTARLARELGYRGIGIYGHPAYYPRFGFQNAEAFGITTPDGSNFDAFMMLPLYENSLEGLSGRFYESSAFETEPSALAAFDAAFPYKEKRFVQK